MVFQANVYKCKMLLSRFVLWTKRNSPFHAIAFKLWNIKYSVNINTIRVISLSEINKIMNNNRRWCISLRTSVQKCKISNLLYHHHIVQHRWWGLIPGVYCRELPSIFLAYLPEASYILYAYIMLDWLNKMHLRVKIAAVFLMGLGRLGQNIWRWYWKMATSSMYIQNPPLVCQWDWCFFARPWDTAESSLLEASGFRAHAGAWSGP